MSNNPKKRLDWKMFVVIRGLDSKVKNAKSNDGSLGFLRVRVSMLIELVVILIEEWIIVYGRVTGLNSNQQ